MKVYTGMIVVTVRLSKQKKANKIQVRKVITSIVSLLYGM